VAIFTFSIPANTGKFLPVSVFGVPNTGIPVSVYTGLETLIQECLFRTPRFWVTPRFAVRWRHKVLSFSTRRTDKNYIFLNLKTSVFVKNKYFKCYRWQHLMRRKICFKITQPFIFKSTVLRAENSAPC
jgi:hypothetical protein